MNEYDLDKPQNSLGDIGIKLLACVIIVMCLILGLAGLILPIIPGLLFLALAGIVAAHYFPPLERALRRSPQLAAYLDRFSNFSYLTWSGKLRLLAWLCLKVLVDTVAFMIRLLIRLIRYLSR